jgi:pilus assembly protein TadC
MPAAVCGLGFLESAEQQKRRQRLTGEIPKVCDLLSVCLASGLPLRSAVGVVAQVLDGELAQTLREVSARVELGADEAEAWMSIAPTPGLETFAREIARCTRNGVGLAAVLSALGRDKRAEAFNDLEVEARRVGVKSVMPLMVCFLPAFVLLGIVPIIGGMVAQVLG